MLLFAIAAHWLACIFHFIAILERPNLQVKYSWLDHLADKYKMPYRMLIPIKACQDEDQSLSSRSSFQRHVEWTGSKGEVSNGTVLRHDLVDFGWLWERGCGRLLFTS